MRRFSFLAFLFLFLIPVQAFGQFYADTEQNSGFFVSATTTSTALAAGTVVLTIAEATRKPETIQAFLKTHPVELKNDISLGAGEALAELAALLDIGEHDILAFSCSLRKEKFIVNRITNMKSLKLEHIYELIAWTEKRFPTHDDSSTS